MSDVVNWKEWLRPAEKERGFILWSRAIEGLVDNDKAASVWVSGSRAIKREDSYSDLDLRIHARKWTPRDFSEWAAELASTRRPLVRLSKLGTALWNYECLFEGTPIDLLVFSGETPVISFDSVIFKMTEPLSRQGSIRIIKEESLTANDVQNLMDGFLIDDFKFTKLLARKEQLAVFFLIGSQRLALLRLAYIATRGVDCGPRNQHTLASLKLVEGIILQEGKPEIAELIRLIGKDSSVPEKITCLRKTGDLIFPVLVQCFPGVAAS